MKLRKRIVFCLLIPIFLGVSVIPHVCSSQRGSNSQLADRASKTAKDLKRDLKNLDKLSVTFAYKCYDKNVGLQELYDACKAYKEAKKVFNENDIAFFERTFKDYKEKCYKYVPQKEQKNLEAAYKDFMSKEKRFHKLSDAGIDSRYEYTKAKREHSQNKTDKTKRGKEQAKKRMNITYGDITNAINERDSSFIGFIDKKRKICEQYICKDHKELCDEGQVCTGCGVKSNK